MMSKFVLVLEEIVDGFEWIYTNKLSRFAKVIFYVLTALEFVVPMLGMRFGFMSNGLVLAIEFDACIKSGLILNHIILK